MLRALELRAKNPALDWVFSSKLQYIFRASDGSHYEKRGKGEPVCIDNEIPFDIPDSWEWARLESCCRTVIDCPHSTPTYLTEDTGFYAIDTNCMDEAWNQTSLRYLSKESFKKRIARYAPQPGDLVLSREGSIGRSVILSQENVCLGQRVMVLCFFEDGLLNRYCQLVLTSPYAWDLYMAVNVGTGVKHINVSMIKDILIPLPPKGEQVRMVEMVENLQPYIYRYDTLEVSRERLDAELPGRLRKSILQQAVQGRLVAQDPSDEPASALLKRIRAERAKLVKAGELKAPKGGESVIYRSSDGGYYEKRGKGEPVCIDDEIPFEIPDSWEWVRFTWAVPVSYGFPADSALFNVNGAIGLIRIRDVNSGDLIHTETRYDGDYNKRYIVHAGDDLIGMDGEFRCSRWKGEDSLLNQRVCRLDYLSDTTRTDYVRIALEWYLGEVWKRTSKTTVKHLSAKALDTMLFALPPYEEQIRIAAIINAYLEVQG